VTDVIRDYLKAVGHRMPMDAGAKEQVLRELRAHLLEKAADLARENPSLSREDVERRVVREFGDPDELAFAYGGGRAVVRSSKGEVVLRVGRALGRGTKAFLKWTAIAVAFLLVLGSALSYAVYQESKPYLQHQFYNEYATQVFYRVDSCGAERCNGLPSAETFGPPEGAKRIEARIMVSVAQAGGSVRISVTDPAGATVYDRTFSATTSSTTSQEELVWTAVPGAWKVTTHHIGFSGTAMLDFYARGTAPVDA
jgi:hypothetical protein